MHNQYSFLSSSSSAFVPEHKIRAFVQPKLAKMVSTESLCQCNSQYLEERELVVSVQDIMVTDQTYSWCDT